MIKEIVQATMKLICLLFTITVLHFTARAQTFAWAKAMGGALGPPYSPNESGNAIKTDSYGNVLTTGSFAGTADFDPGVGVSNLVAMNGAVPGDDMFIQKLDANGNFLWAKQLVGDSSSAGLGLALDLFSNVYITGAFRGTKDFDPGSGVYNLTSSGVSDIFVLKLDANGNFIWARSMGGSGNEGGRSLVVDNSGNVYVIGPFQASVDFDPGSTAYTLTSNGHFDVFILKLNSSGNFVWAVKTGGTGGDDGNEVCLDNSGNIIASGGFNSTADFDPGPATYNLTSLYGGIFIWKLTASGNLIWAKQMSGTTISTAYGAKLVADKQNKIYYTGQFAGTVDFDPGPGVLEFSTTYGPRDIIVSKLDESGNLIWAKQIGNLDEQQGIAITVDHFANVYFTGFFQGIVDFDPGTSVFNLTGPNFNTFVGKLDSSGKFVWAGSVTPAGSQGNSITVNNSGDIYCTGYFRETVDFDPGPNTFNITSNGSSDIFVLKLNQSGTVTGIVNPDNEFQIKVLPNPAHQTILFTAKNVTGKLIQVQLINILGQTMYKSQKIMGSANFSQQIDLSKLPAGSYILEAVIGNKRYTRKIEKIE